MVNKPHKALLRALNKAQKRLKIDAEAAVFLLEGRKMAEIKRRYEAYPPKADLSLAGKPRGPYGPYPDVLAFPEPEKFPHPEKKKAFLGEIYIARTIAERDPGRARYLLVHGLLHLLGYTHKGKADTIRMERKEQELLSKIFGNRIKN